MLHLLPAYEHKLIAKWTQFAIVNPTHMCINSLNYYHSCFLLYKPHRCEKTLLGSSSDPQKNIFANSSNFDSNAMSLCNRAQELDPGSVLLSNSYSPTLISQNLRTITCSILNLHH